MEAKLAHPWNALALIIVIEFGSLTLVIDLFWNASTPISVTV